MWLLRCCTCALTVKALIKKDRMPVCCVLNGFQTVPILPELAVRSTEQSAYPVCQVLPDNSETGCIHC